MRVMARFVRRLWEWLWPSTVHLFSAFRSLVDYFRLALDGGATGDREEASLPPSPEGLQRVDTEPTPTGWSRETGAGRVTGRGEERPEDYEWLTDEEEKQDEGEACVETTDEFYCSYDSTWESHEGARDKGTRKPLTSYRSSKFRRFESAARDMQNYRRGYPEEKQRWWSRTVSSDMPNYDFYLGKAPSQPDGAFISDFHMHWFGQHEALEFVHTYIQWLFPLQEPGLNSEATPLTKEEVERFLRNPTAKDNLFKSYLLMLDFYGIRLSDEKTGEVERASNWEERFRNLNTHTHNNLRITRILKCLGTLGFPHYQAPLVRFFLTETLINGQLPKVKDSVLNYFVFAVLDKRSRRHLLKFAFLSYKDDDEFVWCPKKLQRRWMKEA